MNRSALFIGRALPVRGSERVPEVEQAPEKLTAQGRTEDRAGVGSPGLTAKGEPGVLMARPAVTVLPHKKSPLKWIPFARLYCPYCILIFVTLVTNIKFFYLKAGNEYFFPPTIHIGSKCDDGYSICD